MVVSDIGRTPSPPPPCKTRSLLALRNYLAEGWPVLNDEPSPSIRLHYPVNTGACYRVIAIARFGVDAPRDRLAPFAFVPQDLKQRAHEFCPADLSQKLLCFWNCGLVSVHQSKFEPEEQDLVVSSVRQTERAVECGELFGTACFWNVV